MPTSAQTIDSPAEPHLTLVKNAHQPQHTLSAGETFIGIVNQLGTTSSIRNVETQLKAIEIAGQIVPITVNRTEYENSYVCSPYTAYISYGRDELGLIKNALFRSILKTVIGGVGKLLRAAQINQTISINNWLVSTNLLPHWTLQDIEQFTSRLVINYPDHSLMIRSLNRHTDGEVMNQLEATEWLFMPARQVYLFDHQDRQWWKRSHTKRDQSFLRKTQLTRVAPQQHQDSDFADIEFCFNKLFIDKHSQYNPQFTAEFMKQLHRAGLVYFHSFRNDEGRIIASIGLFTQQNIITTPIVGYDTEQPKELGLYRLLMAVLLKETYESGKMMNLSSGAGGFKRARGGQPEVEYTALYIDHLSGKQKWLLKQFAKLLRRYGPKVLQDNEV